MARPTMEEGFTRRTFLARSGGMAGAAWLAAVWPAALATAGAARAARGTPFKVLSAAEAAEVEAIAAAIIPSGETPGAREAGVVYFVDEALAGFMAGASDGLKAGLAAFGAKRTPDGPLP